MERRRLARWIPLIGGIVIVAAGFLAQEDQSERQIPRPAFSRIRTSTVATATSEPAPPTLETIRLETSEPHPMDASLEGSIFCPDGSPPSSAGVTLLLPDGTRKYSGSLPLETVIRAIDGSIERVERNPAGGSFRLDGLPIGPVTVVAEGQGASIRMAFWLRPGWNGLNLHLRPNAGFITGRLVFEDGRPAADVPLMMREYSIPHG